MMEDRNNNDNDCDVTFFDTLDLDDLFGAATTDDFLEFDEIIESDLLSLPPSLVNEEEEEEEEEENDLTLDDDDHGVAGNIMNGSRSSSSSSSNEEQEEQQDRQFLSGGTRDDNHDNDNNKNDKCSCEQNDNDNYSYSMATMMDDDVGAAAATAAAGGGTCGMSSFGTITTTAPKEEEKEEEEATVSSITITNVLPEAQRLRLLPTPTPEVIESANMMVNEAWKLPTTTTILKVTPTTSNKTKIKKDKRKKIIMTKTTTTTKQKLKKKTNEEEKTVYISKIGKFDVLFGKGGGEYGNHHPNKQAYLELIKSYQPQYKNEQASLQERKQIVDEIMEYIQKIQGGKFIKYDKMMKNWYIVTNREARSKVTQCLRDDHDPLARKLKREKYAKPK